MCQFINSCPTKKHSPGTKAFEKCRKLSVTNKKIIDRTSKLAPKTKTKRDDDYHRRKEIYSLAAGEKAVSESKIRVAYRRKDFALGLVEDYIVLGEEKRALIYELSATKSAYEEAFHEKEKYFAAASMELAKNGKTSMYNDLLACSEKYKDKAEKLSNASLEMQEKYDKVKDKYSFLISTEFNNLRKRSARAKGKYLATKKKVPSDNLIKHKIGLINKKADQTNLDNVKEVVGLLEKKFAHQKAKSIFYNNMTEIIDKRIPLVLNDEDELPQKAIKSSQEADQTLEELEEYKQKQREIEEKIFSQDHNTFGRIRKMFSKKKETEKKPVIEYDPINQDLDYIDEEFKKGNLDSDQKNELEAIVKGYHEKASTDNIPVAARYIKEKYSESELDF